MMMEHDILESLNELTAYGDSEVVLHIASCFARFAEFQSNRKELLDRGCLHAITILAHSGDEVQLHVAKTFALLSENSEWVVLAVVFRTHLSLPRSRLMFLFSASGLNKIAPVYGFLLSVCVCVCMCMYVFIYDVCCDVVML